MNDLLEIEEETIKGFIEHNKKEGIDSPGFSKILEVGEIYREYGLTPIYYVDQKMTYAKITCLETRDISKLH